MSSLGPGAAHVSPTPHGHHHWGLAVLVQGLMTLVWLHHHLTMSAVSSMIVLGLAAGLECDPDKYKILFCSDKNYCLIGCILILMILHCL